VRARDFLGAINLSELRHICPSACWSFAVAQGLNGKVHVNLFLYFKQAAIAFPEN